VLENDDLRLYECLGYRLVKDMPLPVGIFLVEWICG